MSVPTEGPLESHPPNSVSAEEIVALIRMLLEPATREVALLELSRRREACAEMAPLLWHSFGVVACIVQELLIAYPCLSPPTLSGAQSNRVCNAIALLQCIAAHPATMKPLLDSGLIHLLFPLLDNTAPGRSYEYIRLTSLGVIGALLKTDPAVAVPVLLQSELIPLTLRIVEAGQEISKVVATFIIQVVLQEDVGLAFLCASAERFYGIVSILGGVLRDERLTVRLLRHVFRCMLRLCDWGGIAAPLATAFAPYLQLPSVLAVLDQDPTSRELHDRLSAILAAATQNKNEKNNNNNNLHNNNAAAGALPGGGANATAFNRPQQQQQQQQTTAGPAAVNAPPAAAAAGILNN